MKKLGYRLESTFRHWLGICHFLIIPNEQIAAYPSSSIDWGSSSHEWPAHSFSHGWSSSGSWSRSSHHEGGNSSKW
jgi:hypothetical protein